MTATVTASDPLPRRGVPRTVSFVTVKRNVPLTGRSYGHWWVEVDRDESYGWWPGRCPLGLAGIIRGTAGLLNGMGVTSDGAPGRDPSHGLLADYEFHLDGRDYLEGVDLDADGFYEFFAEGRQPSVATAAPSPGRFGGAYSVWPSEGRPPSCRCTSDQSSPAR